MRQACFTGFYPIIPYSCQMKMYQLSKGKRNQKDWVTLFLCANSDDTNKIPCYMIGKSIIPAGSVGKCWPIPYCSQHKAWMDQPTYQKWLDSVFLPSV